MFLFVIEKEEFRLVFLQIQSELSQNEIDQLFSLIDQNEDDHVSFLEFLAVMIDPREVDIKEMNQVSSILLFLLLFFLILIK
jgi:Ca2+-binding EF-hand superfamily protein